MDAGLSLAAWLMVGAIAPTSSSLAQASGPTAPLPEIVVNGLEPRYVAPTRRDRIGRIWAPVLIDGKGPFRLVLDTGANHSVVTSSVADALGVAPEQRGEARLRGVTGVMTVETIPVRSFEVGDLLIEPATLPIVTDALGGADGVLGNEGLQDKRIQIEFLHDRITITHSHGERAATGFSVVPVRVASDGLLTVPGEVGLVRVVAVIDTGAQRTIGNLALARALQRGGQWQVKEAQIVGMTPDEQTGESRPAPPITIGKASIAGARIVYSDVSIFEHWGLDKQPALIVGMDVLGVLDTLVIDYKRRELQLLAAQPRSW